MPSTEKELSNLIGYTLPPNASARPLFPAADQRRRPSPTRPEPISSGRPRASPCAKEPPRSAPWAASPSGPAPTSSSLSSWPCASTPSASSSPTTWAWARPSRPLLVARELWDRGEIKRLCVLCPPYLCDQWQKELSEKFNLEAVVIRSGTIHQLERQRVGHDSIYQHYPIQVASIDFLKSDRNKQQFLLHCPDLVIVDEAHGSAVASDRNQSQHQRHELVRAIAAQENRHLILLTATPHSGIESAFRSLLSLLRPELGSWSPSVLTEPQRIELARHFVQRTRRDIETDWEGEHCFPRREPSDETYRLSPAYQDLFTKTYDFCSEIVRSGQALDQRQQRVRYWGALALLRCVMSSPAAAVAALETARHDALADGPRTSRTSARTFLNRPTTAPTTSSRRRQWKPPMPRSPEVDRRKLRELGRLAKALLRTGDTKLDRCAELVGDLLRDGLSPIVWCRYIATAESLAEGLHKALRRAFPFCASWPITGRLGDDERRAKVEELSRHAPRVLVATDCLSEGINLQGAFNATLHYDLPWNPNRLEQRDGRVDRYGQPKPSVRSIRYFSPDSAVDGIVLDVLLNKAREIHRTLGTYVPVPEESESVTEAVLNALFLRGRRDPGPAAQLELDLGVAPQIATFHRRWDLDAAREKSNRTRFAQRSLKPGDVRQELEATDAVLGDPAAVRAFVLAAAQRLGLGITRETRPDVFRVGVGAEAIAPLPPAITLALPVIQSGPWLITFTSPTPDGAEYLGRNHRFVVAVARFLLEEALTRSGSATASRCGVLRTRAVSRLTTILLLRVRYLLHRPDRPPLLSEEVLVTGFTSAVGSAAPVWLAEAEAFRLLAEAQPDANLGRAEKRELTGAALAAWPTLEASLRERIKARAEELERSHKRVRQAVALRVRELSVDPQLPPDLLGILVLQPVVG